MDWTTCIAIFIALFILIILVVELVKKTVKKRKLKCLEQSSKRAEEKAKTVETKKKYGTFVGKLYILCIKTGRFYNNDGSLVEGLSGCVAQTDHSLFFDHIEGRIKVVIRKIYYSCIWDSVCVLYDYKEKVILDVLEKNDYCWHLKNDNLFIKLRHRHARFSDVCTESRIVALSDDKVEILLKAYYTDYGSTALTVGKEPERW